MKQQTKRHAGLGMIVLWLTASTMLAQVEPTLSQIQRENQERLRQYSWKSRSEVQKGGKTRSVQLTLVRFDARGMLQRTPISETSADLPQRGLRGRIARNKKEDLLEALENLKALAGSYADLHPADIQRLMESAVAVPGGVTPSPMVRANGTNVLQNGDAMTLWIDAGSRKLRRVEIASTFDKKTVRIVTEYQDLPNGPTAVVRSVIQYPSEELTLITDNFEFVKATP